MTSDLKTLSLVDMAYVVQLNADRDPLLIPCHPKTKYPPMEGWQRLATCDLVEFEKLCRAYPHATMLSVLCGAKAGIFALDFDRRNGGAESSAALDAKHGKRPATCGYPTPGGWREVYRFPEGVNVYNRAGDIAPGVDVRGSRADGSKAGQMIVPESRNAKGGGYFWPPGVTGLNNIAEAPLWLIFLVVFNAAQRAQLAQFGIDGPEGFSGLAPAQWEDRLRALQKAKAPAELRTALNSQAGRSQLAAYITTAIKSELENLAKVEEGKRDVETIKSAIRICSLIKGAAALGLDTTAIADAAYLSFLETANELMPDAPSDQWAEDKWRRAEVDAYPRPIKLKQLGSDASLEFEAIEGVSAPAGGTSATPATAESDLLEYTVDVSLAEIIERQSHALVKGVLHPGETGMIYGDSTAGKTFVGIDLGWHVALGIDWHGRRTKQAPVLYVCLEGVEGFRKRMLAAAQVHGDPGKWFARLKLHVSLVKSEAGVQGAEKIIEAALLQAKETGQPPGIIQIDTLARATAGDDENAVSDMMAFVEKRAGEIARRTGGAVVVVHHENKQGGLRGSSSLRGAFDAMLRVERFSQDADAGRRVVAEKVKDDDEGPLFDFKLRVVELGRDNDDLPVTSCVLETSAPTAKATPTKETEGQKALREALEAAVAAGKGMPHPDGKDAPAAPETAVREHFKSTYRGNGEPSEGAIRNAWSKALKDPPADIMTKEVDGVTCLYVWTPPEQPKDPSRGTYADDEFTPVVNPDEGLEPTEK